MANTSPWSKRKALPPDEMIQWLYVRDRVALQLRMNAMGKGYPPYKKPGANTDQELVNFLSDIIGKRK